MIGEDGLPAIFDGTPTNNSSIYRYHPLTFIGFSLGSHSNLSSRETKAGIVYISLNQSKPRYNGAREIIGLTDPLVMVSVSLPYSPEPGYLANLFPNKLSRNIMGLN